jgi:putative RecB family exonuclease
MNLRLTSAPTTHERQGGAFSYVSASRLNLWLKCPLAFKMRYVDGIKTPSNPAVFVGKMTHESLAVFNRHLQLGIRLTAGDLAKRIEQSWAGSLEAEGLTFDSAYEERALRQQVVDLVSAYLGRFGENESPLAVETALETPLIDPTSGEDLGLPLVGVIDLVLDQASRPLIIDFKTSARSAEPLEITNEIQLSCYAYLYRHCSSQREDAVEIRTLVKTKLPRVESYRYPARSVAHFGRLLSAIRAYLDDLDKGKFTFRPGFGCTMCDFRESHCRDWGGT